MDGDGAEGHLQHPLLDKKQITELIMYPLPYEVKQNQFILEKKLENVCLFICLEQSCKNISLLP